MPYAPQGVKGPDDDDLQFKNQNRTVGSSTFLQIFNQNIRGLRSKNYKVINSLETDNINPCVL
jgi:hypothetical protein